MIAELTEHRAEMVQLCRRFGVRRLDVFGSATSGDFDSARSDIDFLVELEPPAGTSRFDAFFGLKEGLEAILGRSVDLVDPSALDNPYFAAMVEQTRQELYAA
ncbi:MAG: nucleotidyltransferase domain-containing protein [Actinomycetota bacterium]|nr:nucleotidyltransferase domain-containing protein [Actinomycetota bacterium]MDQ6946390.1 nucleotidyltransferase domain-containing protein [Actinomycetota bacterium]